MLSRTIRLKTVLIAAATVMLMVGCKSKQAASDDPATGSGSGAALASGSGAVTASGSGSAVQQDSPLAAGETDNAREVTPPAADTERLCLAVIAKMVACEKDPKFRSALFHRDDPAARTAMQEHFDTHVVRWRKPAEAKAQCQKWASGVYVDTSFSEKVKLERLAAENKHACHFFAAEIVDEGGLPVALTDAKPQRI